MACRHQLHSPLTFLWIAALLTCSLTIRAADAVDGNLLLVAKAEEEIYHNGRKIVLRDKSEDVGHYRAKVPERSLKAGDVFVLNKQSGNNVAWRILNTKMGIFVGTNIGVKRLHSLLCLNFQC